MDPELQYHWFVEGLAPGESQSVTAWATAKELSGEVAGLDAMMPLLRIKDQQKATATALADKGELACEGNPEMEPTDGKAVVARVPMRRKEDRKGTSPRETTPGRS